MSDLPCEMTIQIFSTPPRSIRSTRYSLTARGRSVEPSNRLPTGSSSFEKASGCIRLPAPAAGMMPHILHLQQTVFFFVPQGGIERRLQIFRAMFRGVFGQRALTRRAPNFRELFRRQVQGRHRVFAPAADE